MENGHRVGVGGKRKEGEISCRPDLSTEMVHKPGSTTLRNNHASYLYSPLKDAFIRPRDKGSQNTVSPLKHLYGP